MSVLENLALAFEAVTRTYRSPFRSEDRHDDVRIVEYARFPRVGAGAGPRIAFTRDVSESGLCVGSDHPEPEGALLRIVERSPEGRPRPAYVGRVVWCRSSGDGRHWIGIERVTCVEPD